jgi:hypothetical protein
MSKKGSKKETAPDDAGNRKPFAPGFVPRSRAMRDSLGDADTTDRGAGVKQKNQILSRPWKTPGKNAPARRRGAPSPRAPSSRAASGRVHNVSILAFAQAPNDAIQMSKQPRIQNAAMTNDIENAEIAALLTFEL